MLRKNSSQRKATSKWFEIIVGLTTLNVLVTLSYAAVPNPNEFQDNCREKCHTKNCADEASNFIYFMNDQADPCDNFYEFVCGSYIRKTHLSPEDDSASVVGNVQNDIAQDEFEDLAEEVKDSDWDAFKKLKTYYQNCMNTERIQQIGTAPLLRLLDAIGGWPVLLGSRWNEQRFDLWQSLYRINEMKTPAFFPVLITTEIDNTDSRKYALNLANGQVTVNPVWFADTTDPDKVSRVFLNMMLKVATILGARNDSTTFRELQQVLEFEKNLYRIQTPAEEIVNIPLSESRMTIKELKRKNPAVPWLEFINRILQSAGLSVDDNEVIYLADPKFVSEVMKLIQRTPKKVLANFLAWKIAQFSLDYMPEPLNSAGNEYQQVSEGTASAQDRSTTCNEEVTSIFAMGLSSMYVNKHFHEPIEEKVTEMFKNIKAEARKNLQQIDWMDDATKRHALEKLDAMSATVGYDKELKNRTKVDEYYRELIINPGSFMENAFNGSDFRNRMQLGRLRKPTSADKWSTKPSVTDLNAYNYFQLNSIELPAGFLKYLFKLDRPEYINYGISGAFVGHEIFHGFDNQGKQFDARGNQINWWTPEDEKKFKQRAQCIIDQYGNFTVPEVNINVNGELSQGENIADNGGFRAAYLAYKEYTRRHNIVEGCLPSLNYTPEQMFWISSASIWCSKERPEYTKSSMLTDSHSPNIARVNIVFSNIKEFADDFKCKLGSKMNPIKKCKVW